MANSEEDAGSLTFADWRRRVRELIDDVRGLGFDGAAAILVRELVGEPKELTGRSGDNRFPLAGAASWEDATRLVAPKWETRLSPKIPPWLGEPLLDDLLLDALEVVGPHYKGALRLMQAVDPSLLTIQTMEPPHLRSKLDAVDRAGKGPAVREYFAGLITDERNRMARP